MTRPERYGWIAGTVGLLLAALGWMLEPSVFPHAWLAATVAFAMWPLGSMALLLAHSLTGGRWGEAARPGLLLGVATLPLLLPAVVPVVLGAHALYPWVRPEDAAHLKNTAYLNVPFAAGRGIVYLVVWLAIAAVVVLGRGALLARAAPVALILLALSFTFAAIDSTMSLQPEFTSTIFGMMTAAEAGMLALAMAVLLSGQAAEQPVLADLAKLLLALVVLWTYLDFIQLLIVWQNDLAKQAPWYVRRMHGTWGAVMAIVAIGHFVLPFFLLIFPQVQRSRRAVAGVAALLVAMVVLRSWWTVIPAAPRGPSWVDFACMAGLGGIALGSALWLGRHPFAALRQAEARRHV